MLKEPVSTLAGDNDDDRASVSVLVPSYNHAPFVEKCLRSIFNQTLAPSELVVIDDGSSDNSPNIIEWVLKECPFACEFMARGNRGLCATLNEGFARTRGNYFAYLGSDDVWLPEFLQARVELLGARPDAVLAYGNAYGIDQRGRVIDCTADWARYRDGDVRRMLMETLAPLSPTVLYRRGALARHRWNEGSRLEDYEMYLRLSVDGDFAFDPRVLSAWRRHGHNTSRDLTLMMSERLAAQRQVAPALGLGARELEYFQAFARFRSAEEFMRAGEKIKAIGLMAGSLRGLPSAGAAARLFLSFFIPHRLLMWRKRVMRRRAGGRYDVPAV